MGDWNSLDAIKAQQAQAAAAAAAEPGVPDAGGWIEEPEGGGGFVRHHLMTLAVLGAACLAFRHRDYLRRLRDRWWNGCAPPPFPTGASARAVPPIRSPLLPPTVQLKAKRVGGAAAVLGANPQDTVQELISRIEAQLDVAVQNLLYAGEILTLFRSQTLAEARVGDGATLVYTVRQPGSEPAAGGGVAGQARALLGEGGGGSGGSVLSRVAGPAQLAPDPSKPKATRCMHCNDKLPPMATALQCRCGGFYCAVHRPPTAHECTYDPQQATRLRLRENLRPTTQGEAAVVDSSEAQRYGELYAAEHPELERSVRTAHGLAFVVGVYYCAGALWSFSLWSLLRGVLLSSLLAKGAHAYTRWSSEGTVTCSCRYCLWSLEGARNPSLAWACEWEALKEGVCFAVTAGKSNCLTGQLYSGERTVHKIATVVWAKLREKSE